jgi:DNA repair exonuclease SbcCD ATPase subunit
MTSKTMTTAEKQEAQPAELNRRVEQLQKSLDDLNERLTASRQLQSQLATERETLVLPARVTGDAGAQKRLREIDTQLARARQDISDDATAIAELGAQLTAAEQAAELAEWEARRAKVRSLLIARLKSDRGSKLQKAAKALVAELDALESEDNEIRAEVLKFEPRLSGSVSPITYLPRHRGFHLGYELQKHVPIDRLQYYAGGIKAGDLAADDRKYFGEALEALDRLELVF